MLIEFSGLLIVIVNQINCEGNKSATLLTETPYDADIDQYPWTVSIRSSSNQHSCMGVIIAPNFVVTADGCPGLTL